MTKFIGGEGTWKANKVSTALFDAMWERSTEQDLVLI